MTGTELVAILKSPTSKLIFFGGLIIAGAFIALSFITRGDEKDAIVSKHELTSEEKEPITIQTNTKPYVLKKRSEAAAKDKGIVPPPVIGDPAVKPEKPEAEKPSEPKKTEAEKPEKDEPPRELSRRREPAGAGGMRFSGSRGNKEKPVESTARIFVLSGESKEVPEDNVFLSEQYASYGRLLDCKLINTLESNIPNTPLIAVVLEDLWWTNAQGEKKLIIPAGTEVHGKMGSCVRNRMMCSGNFILVWQITSEQVGMELQLQGTILEKSNQPGSKDRATITDMAAGIPGRVMNNQNMNEMLQYVMAFTMGLAQGFETNTTYSNGTTIITSNDGSTKNALAHAFESLSTVALENISEQIAKESYYIRVAAGTEFYLYITQVTNVEKASIADSELTRMAQLKAKAKEKEQKNQDGSAERKQYQDALKNSEKLQAELMKNMRRNYR